MSVLVRRIRSALHPVLLDAAWPRLLIYGLFWVSTVVLAAVLLIADPVFGTFVVGIPLLLVVLVRERGLAGIPTFLFGAAIGSSLVFSIFLGQARAAFHEGALIAGFVVLLVWAGTYPVMLRQMDRQHLLERFSCAEDAIPEQPHSAVRIYVVRLWMSLLATGVLVAALVRDPLGF